MALLRLFQLPYNGKNNLFIKTIIEKKYSLPVTVLRKAYEYFLKFHKVKETLPVLWHQTLLVYCENYNTYLDEM